jgi:hypothetical protein
MLEKNKDSYSNASLRQVQGKLAQGDKAHEASVIAISIKQKIKR